MSIISTIFILFVAAAVIAYYVVPSKKRWVVILCAGILFYAYSSIRTLCYFAITIFVTYFLAIFMQKIQEKYDTLLLAAKDKTEKKQLKAKCKKQKKLILAFALLFAFGVLAVFKYFNFVVLQISALFSIPEGSYRPVRFLIPLGISFYTFTITSYLFDVYYNKIKAEKNFAHYALFASYFPSLIQGPINRFGIMKSEFFEKEHPFVLENVQFALQRILWGFFKKMVIADRAAQVTDYIFGNYSQLPWYIVHFGLFMYAIQQYADFAGGIDVVMGVSELFGIRMQENFNQPYFSKSLGEFWRRWHISLGLWMKDYIFYPLSLSKAMLNIVKKLNNRSKYFARVIPSCIGNLVVFLIVGIWHGAEWHFVVYGLFHGGIIAFSVLMASVYKKGISVCKINEQAHWWCCWQIGRTFFLVMFSGVFDYVTDMNQSLGMMRQMFNFGNSWLISNWNLNLQSYSQYIIPFGIVFLILVSYIKEKGVDIRRRISALPLFVRWTIYISLIFSIPLLQSTETAGFLYAQF